MDTVAQPKEEQASTELEVIQPHALELMQRAEIDMQIATAKKYPRDLAKVKRRMLDFATLDEETAESCFYTLTRKESDGNKKVIQGPSVRLAEIAICCYQNIRAGGRVIDNDGRFITGQGVCLDIENNVLVSMEVKRRITNKKGNTFSDDMQVVTGNAAASIAFRNAVFKVVPGVLIKPVYEAAKKVAVGNASTLNTKRAKIIARLNSMQVETPRILAKLGKSSVENIGLEDLELLIGLGTAIKDGETTVDEAFSVATETPEEVAARKIAALEEQRKQAGCAPGETEEDRDARLERQIAEQTETAKAEVEGEQAGQPPAESAPTEQTAEQCDAASAEAPRPPKLQFGRRGK